MAKMSIALIGRLQHPTVLNGQIHASLVIEGEASWVPLNPGFSDLVWADSVVLGIDEIQIFSPKTQFRQVPGYDRDEPTPGYDREEPAMADPAMPCLPKD